MEPVRKIEEGLKELYDSNVGKVERQPDVDIYDLGDSVVIYIDMPGVKKEGIKVRVYDRSVEVTASPSQQEAQGKPIRRERISNFPVSSYPSGSEWTAPGRSTETAYCKWWWARRGSTEWPSSR